jgi:hypothetical protein
MEHLLAKMDTNHERLEAEMKAVQEKTEPI